MEYLVSAIEMSALDRQAIEELAIPGRTLMETAGRAVADACDARLEPGSRVVVACGPGNNGGDGFVTAHALAARGHGVQVFAFADPSHLKEDARAALATIEKAAECSVAVVTDARSLVDFATAAASADLVVDALFGVGLDKEVRGIVGDAIGIINEKARQVVAVDIPSGVDANTGAVLGRAVEAHVTVTFGFAKRGHYLFPGAELCGEIVVADIGIPQKLAAKLGVASHVLHRSDIPDMLPKRRADAHKGHFGTVVVVGGSQETPGAAMLAAQAALRSGAGLVRLAADQQTLGLLRAVTPDVMLLARAEGEEPGAWAARLLEVATALVVGPGWSTTASRYADLAALFERAMVPVCLDADALNILAEHPDLWSKLRAPTIITPHPKEMSRLTRRGVTDVQRDRLAAALELAAARNCIVVLKGAGTVIADPGGEAAIAAVGNPGMATGGTGDVLAGLIGGLLAQGLDPRSAARLGVLAHGAAGDVAAETHGQAGLSASDVIAALGTVWRAAGR
jgi:ADP-dependent NAD(P)H-hydrate dehydratase / NAD(P)H-hydrate epimerase